MLFGQVNLTDSYGLLKRKKAQIYMSIKDITWAYPWQRHHADSLPRMTYIHFVLHEMLPIRLRS